MVLLETQYCRVELDPATTLVRYTRSHVPYRSSEDIEAEAREIQGAFQSLRPDRRVLVDLRAVSPRNDPDFEVAIVKLRQAIYRGATQVVILVRTAVGALQTTRHARDDGVKAGVFLDETLALDHLLERRARAPRARWAPRAVSRRVGQPAPR